MDKMVFKIRGMDCAEEVAILKRELGPLVDGEECLAFDLLNGKLTIETQETLPLPETILKTVRATGMEAVPWEDCGATCGRETLWQSKGRTILCASSLALLATGFAVHAFDRGVVAALGGEDTFPPLVTAFYIAAVIAGGWFIAPKALFAARRVRPDMNLLMTVAVIGAAAIGQWFEAATVTFLFALALVLESWSVGRARRAIGSMLDLSPRKARCVCPHDGDIDEKPVEDVAIGTIIVVRPGEQIPLDGAVTQGATSVNQAPITGESVPVPKEPGAEVFAGTINNEGAFEFKVTRRAQDTTLARIIRMVEEAHARRSPSEQWVETFARYYTPAMMFLALGIMLVPPLLFGGAWGAWFYQALVVLVIACPCALVISTPVSIIAALASAARAGVLVKGGAYIEAPARLKAIALDKTGTLTYGRPEVQRILPLDGHTETELLQRAAAVEALSEHPLARAILRKAGEQGVEFQNATTYHAIKGKGAEAIVDGRPFWLGSHRFAHERDQEIPEVHAQAEALEDAGHSVVFVGNDDHICGIISIADGIRPNAAAAVSALRDAGIAHLVMLTGDNEGTARAVAQAAGIDTYRAELLPEDKAAAIEALVHEYDAVAMVGDGVNDAPAMAVSTVGIAMAAAGTDAAIETADIALMSDDLAKLAWLIRHSRRTLRIIKQNVTIALGLKALFLILALTGAATLWMAIAADMGASLLVIFNGLRLLGDKTFE